MPRFYYTYQFSIYQRNGERSTVSIPANTVGDAADELKLRFPDIVHIKHIGRKP